ncbi:MAG: 3-deoxy-7-phosphoheptulonate synthase, partial [Lentisphaeria bacterium]|nr:3-deoxy-7-phosphoheptulonate synthase [Lentisphaeria bacterium]
MVVILKENPEQRQLDNLLAWIAAQGVTPHITHGAHQTILGLVGDTAKIDIGLLLQMEIVEDVKRVQEPFKNANRKFHPLDTEIRVGDAVIGGGTLTVIAGPCSVESEEQIVAIAQSVKASGAKLLRGGAFKPRTSPYAFQGLREEGIRLLLEAKKASGLPIVTEIMDLSQLEFFDEVDVIQV